MLDRLISGAGALTDRADRLVRALTSGRGPNVLGNRPGSVVVIVLLIAAAAFLGLLAIESTDNPTPRAIAPNEVASADDIGRRVYATIEGVVARDYVETYPDDDGDGIQDEDETGEAWYYFLVDDSGTGVTVRSTRPPNDIARFTATGVVVRDPEYLSEDVRGFEGLAGADELELDDTYYIDSVNAPTSSPQPIDLAVELPAAGTHVTITGPYVGYLDVCSSDADGDGSCEQSEVDMIDAFIEDPGTGRVITVLLREHPTPVPISVTGMLRDDAGSIRDAKQARDLDLDSLGITISDRYLLDDQAAPASAGLSLGLAVLAGLLAAILAIGLVGGYLVFRRSKRPLPSGGRTMGAGDEIPIRVTGALRSEDGLIHVREAKSRLLRFPLEVPAEPVASVEHAETPAVEAEDTPAVEPEAPVAWETPAAPAIPSWSSVVPAGPAAEQPSPGSGRSPMGRADDPDRGAARQARGRRAREGRAARQPQPQPGNRKGNYLHLKTGNRTVTARRSQDPVRRAAELVSTAHVENGVAEYRIEIDAPGLGPADYEVALTDRLPKVRGRDLCKPGADGTFEFVFRLPDHVSGEDLSAVFEDGKLIVRAGIKNGVTRRIEIRTPNPAS